MGEAYQPSSCGGTTLDLTVQQAASRMMYRRIHVVRQVPKVSKDDDAATGALQVWLIDSTLQLWRSLPASNRHRKAIRPCLRIGGLGNRRGQKHLEQMQNEIGA
jgi:hypothetical protein